jgi:cation transport ATPase
VADPTRDDAELQRTMYIAAFWFAAALISGTVTTAILMSTGWRPYRLPLGSEAVWLVSTGVSVLGTVLLAWAGCPVTKRGVRQENGRKSLTVRLGIVAFLVGIAAASLVELFGPVQR